MDNLLDRFLRYVSVNTRSDARQSCCPSTPGQMEFARQLRQEMLALGLSDVQLDDNGYLTALLPGNRTAAPAIGFIAHMDTADYPSEQVKPNVLRNYPGGDIALGHGEEKLTVAQYPCLNNYLGQDLVTTDGTTLLGADNKAGIAVILTTVAHLLADADKPRGDLYIGFTPDEEIGRGADRFPLARFPARWAYTVDGGELGELEYENFNAASATVRIVGNDVHPGTAKGSMINSQTLASRFHAAMPVQQTPEQTEGYEGFFHLKSMSGTVEETTLHYIVRDFDDASFAARKAELQSRVAALRLQEPRARIELEIRDSYRNMRSQIEPHMHIVELAKSAMAAVHVVPKIKPIRGGTDGARLSFMGLPCPNLFTGGHNYHGKHEFIPLQSMQKSVATLIELVHLTAVHPSQERAGT